MTLNDTATLGTSAQLAFGGQTHTFEGTGEVVFASNSQGFINTTTNTNLTIGAGTITIRGKAGRVGSSGATVVVTNEGTIHSDEPGRIDVRAGGGFTNNATLEASGGGDLRLLDTWTNDATITISGGGTLTLDGDWSNTGTIASTDSVVELDGMFTLSDLGTFNRTGGTVELMGTLDNVSDLALDMTTGDWEMRGGRIEGGAVSGMDGAELIFTSSSGTLNGVTFDAPMNLSASSARVSIENGLTLNDTATLGASAQIAFGGQAHTFEGAGEVVFASASQGFVNTTTNTNLTIGSGMTIRGKAGRVGSSGATVMVTNEGTIHSDEAGRIDVRAGGGFTNNATLEASGGGDLRLLDTWTNGGSIVVGETGTFAAASGLPLTGAGDLSVDIGSSADFGVITVTGLATLAGTLNINRTNGFVPTAGESFVIMTYDSVSGAFDTVNGTSISAGLDFVVSVGANDITLTVVAN